MPVARCRPSRATSSTHYVTVCERFDFATAESDYAECGAFHTAPAQRGLVCRLESQSIPPSPLNVYKDGTTVRAEVASVSFFKRGNDISDLAQVRYVKGQRTRRAARRRSRRIGSRPSSTSIGAAADPRVRRRNPLGFTFDSSPSPSARGSRWRRPAARRSRGRRASHEDSQVCRPRMVDRAALRDFRFAGPLSARPSRRRAVSMRVCASQPIKTMRFIGCAASWAIKSTLSSSAGESFVGLGAGDIEGLSFVAQDNHLFLKPKAGKIATNLTVLTTRRHYQFDYSSRPMPPGVEDPDVIFALRFTYPAADEAAKQAADAAKSASAELESRLHDAARDRPNNIDYWYCGSPTIKPVAASDDGVHTRLRFAAQSELPAIFVRNDDGSESLLNFHLDAGDVIVHRVARRFIVRRGKLTGCIVNQGYSGGGARLDSGTIAPEVERAAQESRP